MSQSGKRTQIDYLIEAMRTGSNASRAVAKVAADHYSDCLSIMKAYDERDAEEMTVIP